jgi:guanine nucleotide-binding protein G(i) subunit alpha
MGCFGGGERASPEEEEQRKRNQEIEAQLKIDKSKMDKEVKILLLGAGDSGKSTILKQMKLIHDVGFSKEDRDQFKEVIFNNIVQSIKSIFDAMERFQIPLGDPSLEDKKAMVNAVPTNVEFHNFPADLAAAVDALWKDTGVQLAFSRAHEYQLNDSAKYYLSEVLRFAGPSYVPTDIDVLHSRVKTTGITETKFKVDKLTYRMFDVGGQRSERKKWIHCFDNVTAVVFLVAISAYDQKLVEDEDVNRMTEALNLFESTCNSKWFANTSFILFLNKIDLFKEKLATSPLSDYFPDFTQGNNYEKATEYFITKFKGLNHTPKQIYHYLTCATDTSQIKFVMAAVNDIIIQGNLRESGLL